MLMKLKKHLAQHDGTVDIPNMIWVAIVFVVGAILLLMITSAFRTPIANWFNNTIVEWFASENGEYMLNDPFAFYERNSNGTYKDVQYVMRNDDGTYVVLYNASTVKHNYGTTWHLEYYNADGTLQKFTMDPAGGAASISKDGKTVAIVGGRLDGSSFVATIPQDS